ncbi:hypothetical protein HG530_001165 [Fusarium avenaceum]|nr:hypothetical protein HG530_001165 [Fusarium avenaceum]
MEAEKDSTNRIGPLYINRELLRQSEELFAAATEVDSFSSTPAGDVHLEHITFDTGHVIIHYLEFATSLRVYIAAEKLSLNQLRELAREELVRMGDKLELSTLIEVMEESISSFNVLPGITAYIESRLLSFSEDRYRFTADRVLAEIGIPDTLSKVLLRSIVLMKASEHSLASEPTIQQVGAVRSALILQPKIEAMKLAEAQCKERAAQEALRKAEEVAVAKEMEEMRDLKCKRAIRGKLTARQKRRLGDLLENAAKRILDDKAARKAKENAVRAAENKSTGGVKSSISLQGNQEQTSSQSDDEGDTGSISLSTKKGNAQRSSNSAQTSGDTLFGSASGQSEDEAEHSSDATYPFTPTFSEASSSW